MRSRIRRSARPQLEGGTKESFGRPRAVITTGAMARGCHQMFGAFLVEEAFVSKERLGEILNRAMHERVRLGTIAVAEGLLTEDESDIINHLQAQHDMRFGDIAVKKGYLTQEQVDYLVSKQGNPFMQFIQILFEENCMTPEELEWKLSEFQESRGFTHVLIIRVLR